MKRVELTDIVVEQIVHKKISGGTPEDLARRQVYGVLDQVRMFLHASGDMGMNGAAQMLQTWGVTPCVAATFAPQLLST